jgi:MFS family permease
MKRPSYILPLIVLSQFAGTSLWFVVNPVLPEIMGGSTSSIGSITSLVQFGFISGTLVFALLSLADRFSSSKVFFFSSLLAALANLLIIWIRQVEAIFILRFATGFFLAGIYPVGMKIAADWFEKGLGKALGFLVGALVLGTAFPNLLKSQVFQFEWKAVLIFTSVFALLGGLLILIFVGEGPYKKQANQFHPSSILNDFKSPDFRAAAIGYFGHMWELYAFWSFVPAILLAYNTYHSTTSTIYGWTFAIIAIGSVGCVLGGYLSQKMGSARVAFYSLLISGLCCALSVFMFQLPATVFYILLLIWGTTVVADSPQFSTLVAERATPSNKGTSLTMVTCIGFALTIVSIQLINFLFTNWGSDFPVFIILGIGPLMGLFSMRSLGKGYLPALPLRKAGK